MYDIQDVRALGELQLKEMGRSISGGQLNGFCRRTGRTIGGKRTTVYVGTANIGSKGVLSV